MSRFQKNSVLIAAVITLVALVSETASSHCDTMNGPVIVAAKKALETGNVNLVLIWVQPKDETQIREAFQKTLGVRKLSADAQKLADMYFFETLVRVHRAGEGVAYTGLMLAETEVDPGIAAADKSLESGSVDPLIQRLDEAIHHGLKQRYEQLTAKKKFKTDDLEAGREYVKAYVSFIHYVERLDQAAKSSVEGHFHDEGETRDGHNGQ